MNLRRLGGTSLLLALLPAAVLRAQEPVPEPAVQTSSAATSAPAAAQKAGPPGAVKAAAPVAAAKAADRIELGTTQISGNAELPKVMYVVPWRRADLGGVEGRPANSLLDEALTPVDRDVFRRQNRYYAALQAGADASKSQPGVATPTAPAPTAKDEK
jgi:hypothetical protein